MCVKYFAFGILLISKYTYNDAAYAKFTNVVCDNFNKTWITINECRLRALNRNTTVFNFNGTFHYPANEILTDIQLLKKANGYKPWLYKLSIDSCQFIKKPYHPFAIIIFRVFRQFSNINHTCPYIGPQIVKGFYLKPDLMKLPFPTGDYLLNMLWNLHKKPIFTTNVYFTYTED